MLHSIKTKQLLKADLAKVWDFISSPKNLAAITPAYMGFSMLTNSVEKMFAGQIIEYHVSPVAGIIMHWVTEITHVEHGVYFVDEQRFGPYSFWHHKHFLKETRNGIEMNDEVHYKLPLGPIGVFVNSVYVKKQLQSIFDYRYKKLDELFNHKQ